MIRDVETCCKGHRPTTKTELESLLREDYYRALEPVFPDKTLRACIEDFSIRKLQIYLSREMGVEFVKRDPIRIPKVDSSIVFSVFGDKSQAAEEKLKVLANFISLGNSKYGQAFCPTVPKEDKGKLEKSMWADKVREEFGKPNFDRIYEDTQFRTTKMIGVSLSTQMLLRYLKNNCEQIEIAEIVRLINQGTMERIYGDEDGTRQPYTKLDKSGKIEVVRFVEKSCINLLNLFSTERASEIDKLTLDNSLLSA